MSFHGTYSDETGKARRDSSKEWKADDVKISCTGGVIYFTAPCGETRYMSVSEAKKLTKAINGEIQAWARS